MISAVCQGLLSCRRHIGKREDPGDEVVENLEIIPFLAVSTRKYSDVVSDRQEDACSAGDTHSWLRNYQQENKGGALQ